MQKLPLHDCMFKYVITIYLYPFIIFVKKSVDNNFDAHCFILFSCHYFYLIFCTMQLREMPHYSVVLRSDNKDLCLETCECISEKQFKLLVTGPTSKVCS